MDDTHIGQKIKKNEIKFSPVVIFLVIVAIIQGIIFFSVITKYNEAKTNNDVSVTNIERHLVVSLNNREIEIVPSSYLSYPGETSDLDSEKLLSELGITLSDSDYAYIETDGLLKNCELKKYNVRFDESKVIEGFSTDKLYLDQFITNDFLDVYRGCLIYNNDFNEIRRYLSSNIWVDDLNVSSWIGLYLENDVYVWRISDESKLLSELNTIKSKFTIAPFTGIYEEFPTFIGMYSKPIDGRTIDVENTMTQVELWLRGDKESIEVEFSNVVATKSTDKPIYDFSNLVGTGQTRIDLIRDGQGNQAVYFAELGLEEVQKHVIMPGEEFSYIEKIAKQPGINYTSAGRLIGNGYCNSTTTIFRAALEAGLPITDRSSHAQNIASYDWGYPINAVDSTFFAGEGSEIDLKFINDFDYPIILAFEKAQDENGFQYHYVHILTDSRAIKRNVELYDWKKWDIYSPTHFKAEFKRKVSENGVLRFEDSFFSRYIDF